MVVTFEMNPDAPILITYCSGSKVTYDEPVPGWQLYNGPRWRIIRKALSIDVIDRHVYILSGYLGLAPASTDLTMYDLGMIPEKDFYKNYPQTNQKLEEILESCPNPIHLALTRLYRGMIRDDLLSHERITIHPGSIGELTSAVRTVALQIASYYPDMGPSAESTVKPTPRPMGKKEYSPIKEFSFGGYKIYILPEGVNIGTLSQRLANSTLKVGLPPILEGIVAEPDNIILYEAC